MDLREITNGAALAGAARNFGLEVDELVDFAIKTAQKDGSSVKDVLQKMIDSDLDMKVQDIQTLGLDKYEDVLRGSEETDNSNFFSDYTQEERDKGYQEGKEDKRLRKAAANIADEARYRAGNYDEDQPEYEGRREYRQNQRFPNEYDPDQDDFVVKKKGRIVRVKKQGKGDYRPTNQPGGVIKRRMVKYRPGETRQRFDPRTGEVVTHNIPPEPFYPGARNQEPFDATITGRPEWVDAYNRLKSHIESGAITDPQELEQALALKEDMRTSLEPGYAKARDFDRGVALVKQDRQGLPADVIDTRTESDLRSLTAYGSQVRPTDAGPSSSPDRSASPAEIQAIREAAILKTINNPTEVEPAVGRRNLVDLIGAEAAIRADYSQRPNETRRQFNESIALRDSIINETEAGNFANDQLGRLGEIRILGKGYKSNGKPDWIAETPISFSDPSSYPDAYRMAGPIPSIGSGDATVYFDAPGGNPLAIQGLDIQPLSANAPNVNQALNAPTDRPVIRNMTDLLINQQFQTRQSGTYPQADISGALSTFNTRLEKVRGIAPDVVGNARSLNDVANTINNVLGMASDTGARLNVFGTKVRASEPGPMEVLGKMRYTGPEVQQLANALLQLELGSTNGVNSLAKSEYFDRSGSYMPNRALGLGAQGTGRSVDLDAAGPAISLGRDRINFGETEQMSDYTVGDYVDTANKRVAPALRTLTGENIEGTPQERREALEDARRPFVGQVKGELVGIEGKLSNPNYRFNLTRQTDPRLIGDAIAAQARLRASAKNPRSLTREAQNTYNAQIVNARHYPDVVKVARAGPGGRKRNPASLKRNEDVGPSNAIDSWQTQPGQGAGPTTSNSTQSNSRKRSASSNTGANDAEFRKRVVERLQAGQRARAGAIIAGGVGAAVAGINGLIGDERDRRDQEEQY